MTKKIVIFIAKYLRDYKNSHIFVVEGLTEKANGKRYQDCAKGNISACRTPNTPQDGMPEANNDKSKKLDQCNLQKQKNR